jgi:drug/metabolite transporter (DMT)-like permease
MSPGKRGFLQLLVAAALFSTAGAAIKATQLGSWPVAGLRSLVAAGVICAFLPLVLRRRSWTGIGVGVALSYALTVVLFVHANKLTTSASAIFLQLTAPLYVALLGPWLLRESFRWRHAVLTLWLGFGLVLLMSGSDLPSRTAAAPLYGNILALVSGLCYGLTILGLRHLGRARVDRLESTGVRTAPAAFAVALGNLFAFLICLPAIVPAELAAGNAMDWSVVVYLGLFQLGLGYVLVTRGVETVPAVEASFLLLLEPVLNPLWTLLLLGERAGIMTLLGGAVIVAGAMANIWLETRSRSRS